MNYQQNNVYAGVPYNDVKWYDIDGQPFGTASYFNAMILEDADNIVDTKGAMAVGGNYTSQRGLSLGYGNDGNLMGTGYDPNLVRFLVGGNVTMQGPLVVIGHVMAGGDFKAARGSTYMIGKNGSDSQMQDLTSLYQANQGSRYWRLSDRGNHYAVSSYDVPRYIPAARVEADTVEFFQDARISIAGYKNCILNLVPNGTVTQQYSDWILSGSDPNQNVFFIDVSPNGILDKGIRIDIPDGSLAIIILRTGNSAHIKYGLWGSEAQAEHTLYVFEDAQDIRMDVPAAIWGSILAPQAEFYAHPTGGTVYGNAALRSLHVNPGSGFEFHLYPFVGGVVCRQGTQAPEPAPLPAPEIAEPEPQAAQPVPEPPKVEPAPLQVVPPQEPVQEQPSPTPCPECPPQEPCPIAPPCPVPPPCPTAPSCPDCPPQEPCPIAPPCPVPPPCPTAPPCPECPPQEPCPAAPPCPVCPEPSVVIQPVPIPIPIPCPEKEECCIECPIVPGLIYGCIWGCECGNNHTWEIMLYKCIGDDRKLLCCTKICGCGCFEFKVPFDGYYILVARAVHTSRRCCKCKRVCRARISLKNVGVANLTIE